jgi:YD repeat-containing protein
MRYRPCLLGMFAAAFLLFFATVAGAQMPQVTLATHTPSPGSGHDYIHELNETVDPSSGSVTIKINVPVPAGRQLSVPFYIMYNSGQVLSGPGGPGNFEYEANNPSALSLAGWTYTVPAMTLVSGSFYDENYGDTCSYTTDYVFFDAEGSGHTLSDSTAYDNGTSVCAVHGYSTYEPAQNGTLLSAPYDATTSDGTSYDLSTYAPGSTFFGGTAYLLFEMEDRNGNLVYLNYSGNGVFNYTDTMGREILSSSGFGSGTTTVQSSKFSNHYTVQWGTASYDYTVNYTLDTQDSSGCSYTYSYNGYNVPPSLTLQGSVPAIQSISLPNGQSYTFTYDSTYGRISKITYPSGAYVRYVWGMRPNINVLSYTGDYSGGGGYTCVVYGSEPVITDRYVSPDGVTETEHQQFTYTTPYPTGTASTTRVDTDLTTSQVVRTVTYDYTPGARDFVPDESNQYGSPIFNESSVTYSSGSSTPKIVSKTWYNNDPRELASQITALDGSNVSETDYCYNSFYEVTTKQEFDYTGAGNSTCNNTSPIGVLKQETDTSFASFGQWVGQHPWDGWNGQWIIDRPSSVITKDGSGNRAAETDYTYGNSTSQITATSHDDTYYGSDGTLNRGNLVSMTEQCFPNCLNPTPTTAFTYDDTGQVLTQTDPNENLTHYAYADSFATGTPPGPTDGYLTQITYPSTNGISHIQTYTYHYDDGTMASSTDQNGLTTSYAFDDSLDRLTSVSYPDGGGTEYSYNDAAPMTTTATEEITNSLNLVETTTFDGLDREIRKDTTNGESLAYDEIDTCYDGVGRVSFRSYPYQTPNFSETRCSNTTTPGDTFGYDPIDRTISVRHSDGSTISTAYSGYTTTVTDEAGKTRESVMDGLGRLTKVTENPGGLSYLTTYSYDAIDNITTVLQNAERSRNFSYDSLSRLISSTNPESNWSVANQTYVPTTYIYDADGNLISKTEPAQNQQGTSTVTLTYCYDALNRMTAKGYGSQTCSDGQLPTPAATYVYDGDAPPQGCSVGTFDYGLAIGKRTAMCDTAGSEAWSYTFTPGVGWITTDQRTTNGLTMSSVYQDNLLGSPLSIQYPSGRIINYTYNAGDRPFSASDSSTGVNYADVVHYWANGAPCWTDYGDAITAAETFNTREQPSDMQAISSVVTYSGGGCPGLGQTGTLLDLSYNFNLGNDNGDVTGITNNVDNTRSQSFTYGPLNRITSAQTASTYSTSPAHCWGETFLYDESPEINEGAWGNLTSIGVVSTAYDNCQQESLSVGVTDQNQITASNFAYDTAGNMTHDANHSYTYDAENRITEVDGGSTETYTYDGDGQRVEKSNGTIYWYGLNGEILDESDASGNITNEYVYFGGKRIARIKY